MQIIVTIVLVNHPALPITAAADVRQVSGSLKTLAVGHQAAMSMNVARRQIAALFRALRIVGNPLLRNLVLSTNMNLSMAL